MLERVKLGNTGLDVNRICLGGGSFGGSTAPELVINQLDYFRSLGASSWTPPWCIATG